jgi:hypothetical protein
MSPYTIRTDKAVKIRFTATLDEELEALSWHSSSNYALVLA